MGKTAAIAASPAAMWSGWPNPKPPSSARAGYIVMSTSGLYRRIARAISFRSSSVGSRYASGWSRKTTSASPSTFAAAICSRLLIFANSPDVNVRSLVPLLPSVQRT